ncbi:TetR/AcrR family transcriptional regulator [Lentzea sp. HUAS12]|uniref:TetR/AcrR family transcriptional regulator n=1 Tax=Lentzea sp. HUAS12 TaxID=2951806 RepID=UPI00209FE99A|nr:TetR/AcrR family transcriptional regulator [Lentzea sp. HUAS12]USX48900.1 TetR/AcrR family transcriptional regulator [Lentzea sp. HUAS12]
MDTLTTRAAKELRTRLAIQEAAITLCLDRGFAATSTKAIADRAGVSERTLFRTFGTKAAIFWYDAFLSRVVRALTPDPDPVAALAKAVRTAIDTITPEQWALELGRRAVIISEPDLIATGTQELTTGAQQIATILTPPLASPAQAFDLLLFARFAVAGMGVVPVHADTTPPAWGAELERVVHKAAHGALERS